MYNKIEKTMLEHNIMPKNSVMVALSGGADSVALLHVMTELSRKYKFKVYAAHVNHCLRGEFADRDELFSKKICAQLGVECFCLKVKVSELAEKNKISEELAGREARYSFFNELMDKYNIEYTATAHHKNDNAETIIMNFLRGSSLSGLCGIPYKRDKFIRPMLDVSRDEIEQFCKTSNIEYVTDDTNFQTEYTRNKIRNILIPQLQTEYNPNLINTICSNSKNISTDEEYLLNIAEDYYNALVCDTTISVNELNKMHRAVSSRVIKMMLANSGVNSISSKMINDVLDLVKKNRTGSMCNISSNIVARIEYNKLIIGENSDGCHDFSYEVNIGDSIYIPELQYTVHSEYTTERKNDGAQYFQLDNGITKFNVRNRRAGDVFVPAGMNGMKKVKEYMINEKIPKNQRASIGILTFDEKIAWIMGYRRDNRFKFKDYGVKIWITY